jgi:hypothetical protein
MSCVKIKEDFHSISPEGANVVTSECSFYFDIPESITLPSLFNGTQRNRFSQVLPPSVRVVQAPSNEWAVKSRTPAAGICDVTYHIDARLLKNGETIFDDNREILIMPAVEVPPPLDPEHLKREYKLFSTSAVGSFWRRKKSFMVTSTSKEPRPFIFQAEDGKELPSTELTLNFFASKTLHANDVERQFKPQITHCEISITLESTTYFLEHENRSVMSKKEAIGSSDTVLKATRFSTQKRKMRLGGWNKTEDTTCESNPYVPRTSLTLASQAQDGRMVEWNTMMSVAAFLPQDCPRLPSFFFSLVSRRYAFDVRIRLLSESGICSHKPMRLRIPVQMVHAPLSKMFYAPPESGFDHDLKAPAYVF